MMKKSTSIVHVMNCGMRDWTLFSETRKASASLIAGARRYAQR